MKSTKAYIYIWGSEGNSYLFIYIKTISNNGIILYDMKKWSKNKDNFIINKNINNIYKKILAQKSFVIKASFILKEEYEKILNESMIKIIII